MLPGGDAVLVTIGSAFTVEAWDRARIVVRSLKTGDERTVVTGGMGARYVPTGHIVYAVGGVLFAVPFDPRELTRAGRGHIADPSW